MPHTVSFIQDDKDPGVQHEFLINVGPLGIKEEPATRDGRWTCVRPMANSDDSVTDELTLFRAAVQGVRRCLELGNAPPAQIDELCTSLLAHAEGDNAEANLKHFKTSYKRMLAEGEENAIYLTAILKALDNAKSEEEAQLWVMQSVNAQLLARPSHRA